MVIRKLILKKGEHEKNISIQPGSSNRVLKTASADRDVPRGDAVIY
jgi:hypothetical protein